MFPIFPVIIHLLLFLFFLAVYFSGNIITYLDRAREIRSILFFIPVNIYSYCKKIGALTHFLIIVPDK